jgi:hypothetical protein
MHHQAVFTDATVARVKTVSRYFRLHKIHDGLALIQPSGSLLITNVEVQAVACSEGCHQGLQLRRRGRLRASPSGRQAGPGLVSRMQVRAVCYDAAALR